MPIFDRELQMAGVHRHGSSSISKEISPKVVIRQRSNDTSQQVPFGKSLVKVIYLTVGSHNLDKYATKALDETTFKVSIRYF